MCMHLLTKDKKYLISMPMAFINKTYTAIPEVIIPEHIGALT